MKKILVFLSFVVIPAIGFSQKVYSNYYVFGSPKDSVLIRAKLFTDGEIQSDFKTKFLDAQPPKYQDPIFIKDEDKRFFERIVYHDTIQYLPRLVTGYYNLYSGVKNKNPFYVIVHDHDTTILTKEDKRTGNKIKTDNRYKGILLYLSKDFPEFKNTIQRSDFRNQSIQSIVYNLNGKYKNTKNIKYPATLRRDFFQIGFYSNLTERHGGYAVNLLFIRYLGNFSRDISIRVGLTQSYFQTRNTYQSQSVGNPNANTIIYSYRYFSVPLLFNYEFTNAFVTPYGYIGIIPMVLTQHLQGEVSAAGPVEPSTNTIFQFAIRAGLGVKLKLGSQFNIFSGLRYESLDGGILVYGLEYNFKKPHK